MDGGGGGNRRRAVAERSGAAASNELRAKRATNDTDDRRGHIKASAYALALVEAAGIEPVPGFKQKERWRATSVDSRRSIRCHVPISSPLESPTVPWSPPQSWRHFGDG